MLSYRGAHEGSASCNVGIGWPNSSSSSTSSKALAARSEQTGTEWRGERQPALARGWDRRDQAAKVQTVLASGPRIGQFRASSTSVDILRKGMLARPCQGPGAKVRL